MLITEPFYTHYLIIFEKITDKRSHINGTCFKIKIIEVSKQ